MDAAPTTDSPEWVRIRHDFAQLLNADRDAVLESTRDAGGHVVLNADDLFKQFPPYLNNSRARRWLGPLLYDIARTFTDECFHALLATAPSSGSNVIFTAGGGASGKSTVIRALADRP